jgi:antitoxin (DNA-binding transcriptional repressor) of toxin-antitoxin stability system
MSISVQVDEANVELAKLVAKVESGEDVVVFRGGQAVARMTRFIPASRAAAKIEDTESSTVSREVGDANANERRKSIEALRAARSGNLAVTREEIRAWREEGRRM